MKSEILSERPTMVAMPLSDDTRKGHAQVRGALAARSQLVWGEHCSECAHPKCYTNCAFYTPRSDFNCRRFQAGFEPLSQAPDFKQVRFRQWGKVEALGPARALAADLPERKGADSAWDQVVRWQVIPAIARRKLAYRRQEAAKSTRIGPMRENFDAFVLEAQSADGRDHDLTLSIFNTADAGAELYQAHFKAGPAYGRAVIDAAQIRARVNLDEPYLIQIEPMNEAAGRAVIFGFCDFVRWKGAPLLAAQPGAPKAQGPAKQAKVLIWDLDETLWQGTLAEDRIENLRLRPEAVAAIKNLDERGVLHSVASKNDHDRAISALEHFGLAEYFLSPQISWNPKSTAIAQIAASLNLGVDSFVFIDDQPFERAEVLNSHPQVRVLGHDQVEALVRMDCFDAPITAESRSRRGMYEKRQAEFTAAGVDYRAFLATSAMTLKLEAVSDVNRRRVFELSQRTNQLNFNGKKYSEMRSGPLRTRPTSRL